MLPPEPHAVQEPIHAVLTLRSDLIFTPELSAEKPYYVIEDPARGKFFRVGTAEFTFLSLLDGRTTVGEALGTAASQLGPQALAEHEALTICRWLVDCQLATTRESAGAARLLETAEKGANRRLANMLNPLSIKVPLVDPDRWLTTVAAWTGWIFSLPFLLLWATTGGYALWIVSRNWSSFAAAPGVILDRDNWLSLGVAWFLLKVLHETCHGLACKRYGGNVRAAGLMLILLTPVAFVDVTSAWRFRSKWPRIITAAAGMYIELFAAAIAVIVWSLAGEGTLRYVCFDVAVMASLQTLLFNGNPLLRFDGYFILSDLLGIPNLYSCGQQYLRYLLERYVLGWNSTLPERTWTTQTLIKVYAVAALVWRTMLSLTISLALVAAFSHLGVLLAGVVLIYWYVLPSIGSVRGLWRQSAGQTVHRGRQCVTAGLLVATAAGLAIVLLRPGVVAAPAVVEYAPMIVVRAESPGFVRHVCVTNGQAVERGQVLVRQENRELENSLADLRLAYEQSIVRGRVHFQDGELPKYQSELSNQEALRKKQAEVLGQVDGLVVRAPRAGCVVGRNLDVLGGQYLQAGAEIAVIGKEDVKELTVAVPQEDIATFTAQLGRAVRFRTRGTTADPFEARLLKLEPRAAQELPHPALGAHVGGPLAVKPKNASPNDRTEPGYELLSPRVGGTVTLTAAESAALKAGQIGVVQFSSQAESAGARLVKSLIRWFDQQLARHEKS